MVRFFGKGDNFEAIVRSILDNETVNRPENLMDGLDHQTWRPIFSAEAHEKDQQAMRGDKITGYLYRIGIDTHCPGPEECNPEEIRPLLRILHVDKSHYDLHGSLAITPVGVTLGMFDVDTQQTVTA